MITAGTVVAKLAEFIATKSGDHLSSLLFDRRRKACRSLTKLYFCICALDEAGDDILRTFDGFRSRGTADALVNALNNHMHDVAYATNMFIDLGHELEAGLRIIDPALASTCTSLYRGKYDLLTFLSTSISWDRTSTTARITVRAPTGDMDAVDLEAAYAESQLALGKGDKFYWPQTALDDFQGGFKDIQIGWGDDEAADAIHAMLVRQKMALGQAREKLRALLAERFSIEDVLFQADSHPYR